MRTIYVLFFLMISCQQPIDNSVLAGFWIPELMNWESPPPGLGLDSTRFSDTSTLCFLSDSTFMMFDWVLYKTDHDSLNEGGEGFSFYKGTWLQIERKEVRIKYRLIYRTVAIVGQNLPGDEVSGILAIIDSQNDIFKLKMNDNRVFVRSSKLTSKTSRLIERASRATFP